MALKIKEGVKLHPYGSNTTPFTSESKLTDDVLELLYEKYPESFEGKPVEPTKPVEPKK